MIETWLSFHSFFCFLLRLPLKIGCPYICSSTFESMATFLSDVRLPIHLSIHPTVCLSFCQNDIRCCCSGMVVAFFCSSCPCSCFRFVIIIISSRLDSTPHHFTPLGSIHFGCRHHYHRHLGAVVLVVKVTRWIFI